MGTPFPGPLLLLWAPGLSDKSCRRTTAFPRECLLPSRLFLPNVCTSRAKSHGPSQREGGRGPSQAVSPLELSQRSQAQPYGQCRLSLAPTVTRTPSLTGVTDSGSHVPSAPERRLSRGGDAGAGSLGAAPAFSPLPVLEGIILR